MSSTIKLIKKMVGAGTEFDREDRFYNSVKARRSSQNQLQRAQTDVTMGQRKQKPVISRYRDSDNRAEQIPERVTLPLSNLERFLQAITPSVPAQYLSKTTMRDWRTCNIEYRPYFVLADLWESFKEWSAYGAGVPLVLNGSDSVVQYYVPSLSAIQIYVDPSKLEVKSRRASEDTDGDNFSRDSSSDGSSDSEPDRFSSYSRGKQSHRQMTDVSSKMERLSLRDQQTALQEGFSSDDSESGNSHGYLLFEHLEHDPPFTRGPLADKISDLALGIPELKNLHSCDLMPSSWFSVAWYPIYRIPIGPMLKDFDACFLTYHSLYTPNGDVTGEHTPVLTYPKEMDSTPEISLPVFGLASYKYRGSMWTSSSRTNHQLVNSLSQEAAIWLRLLQVNHPDYAFFASRQ